MFCKNKFFASFCGFSKKLLEWFKTSKNAFYDEICKYKSRHFLECLIPRFKNIFLLANTRSTQKMEITGTCTSYVGLGEPWQAPSEQ
jgi:hypothetical protein